MEIEGSHVMEYKHDNREHKYLQASHERPSHT
jgi:hypothetical protein